MPADPLDELYKAPLAEFIARRKAVATRLRDRGGADEAKAVSRVPKPKATVWAINRVARASPRAVKRLTSAFDALKAAQLRAPAKMTAAAADFRKATEAVVHDAIEAMKAGRVRPLRRRDAARRTASIPSPLTGSRSHS